MLSELTLSHAQGRWGHLDQFVVGDELDRGLERQDPWRVELDRFVVAVRADVRLLLLTGDVHHHVVGTRALADDHALVDVRAGTQEELAARLEIVQGVARRRPGAVGDHRSTLAVR